MNEAPLLEVKNLKKEFAVGRKWFGSTGVIQSIDDVSFFVNRGETLGLVGESGCGKSTLGRVILRLIPPTSGIIKYNGRNIEKLRNRELKPLRKEMQLIFQDPFNSLNPKVTIGDAIAEPFEVHFPDKTQVEKMERIADLLKLVGLSTLQMSRYPHEFSSGQRQRIVLARALALEPSLLVCDEPVSALDVSIQAQIINLLKDLQKKLSLTYIFISHDLSIVKHCSDRIAVMYLGKIIEIADKKEFYISPLHPYSQALLSAIPIPDPTTRNKRIILKGDVPNPMQPPSGCPFRTRCQSVLKKCTQTMPPLMMVSSGHSVACHLMT